MADLEKIAEGREAEIFAWEDGAVLRLMRSPDATQQVEWEARAMEAARAAGVSVPAVRGTTTVNGRPGLIMERVDGPDMLTLIGQRPWLLPRAARVFGGLMAQLHETVAPDDLPELRPRMKQRISSSVRVPKELADFAIAALQDLPDGDRICHGDLHPGNVIWNDDGQAIIDWTGVARGDPTADFVRTDLMIRLGDLPPGSPIVIRLLALVARGILRRMYANAYKRRYPLDPNLVARWEIPVVANRLADGIEPERPKLLRILEERLAQDSTAPSLS